MKASEVTFTGEPPAMANATLLDFWQWAFSDLCDDDIKGIFAEWMVRGLLGLSIGSGRRISWANSDIILEDGTRIEVKASALWQSWKLVNEDGSRREHELPVPLNPNKVRFAGLQARTAVCPAHEKDQKGFKSDFYVFCFQAQTDPAKWDAWNLGQWEFYVMSRNELIERNTGGSISLAGLRSVRPGMSAGGFQSYVRSRFVGTSA